MTEKKKIDLVRLDRNIGKASSDIVNTWKNKAELIVNILTYISITYSENLLRFGKIELKDFAKKMNYPYKELIRGAADPLHFDQMGVSKDEVMQGEWDKLKYFYTVFDDAIYTLSIRPLAATKTYENKNEIGLELETLTFITAIKKVTSKSDSRKIIYHYSLHDNEKSTTFIKHLSNYFLTIDKPTIEALAGRKRLNYFITFYYLLYLYNDKKKEILQNLGTLKNIAGIRSKSPRDIVNSLSSIFEYINKTTEFKFEYRAIKNGKNYAKFGFIFTSYLNIENIIADAKTNIILDNLLKKYREINEDVEIDEFLSWIFSAKDEDLKQDIVKKVINKKEKQHKSLLARNISNFFEPSNKSYYRDFLDDKDGCVKTQVEPQF